MTVLVREEKWRAIHRVNICFYNAVSVNLVQLLLSWEFGGNSGNVLKSVLFKGHYPSAYNV